MDIDNCTLTNKVLDPNIISTTVHVEVKDDLIEQTPLTGRYFMNTFTLVSYAVIICSFYRHLICLTQNSMVQIKLFMVLSSFIYLMNIMLIHFISL